MSFRFELRTATEEERSVLGRHWLPPALYALVMATVALVLYFIAAVLGLLTFVAILGAVGGAALDTVSLQFLDRSPWLEALFVALLWGPVFLVPALIAVHRFLRLRRARQGVWADLKSGQIEWIRIEDEPFRAISIKRGVPHLAFDLPQGGTLLISCWTLYHWICIRRTLDRLEELDDPTEQQINAILEEETPVFPARVIELRRWPGAGYVTDLHGWHELPIEQVRVLTFKAARRIKKVLQRDSAILPLRVADLESSSGKEAMS